MSESVSPVPPTNEIQRWALVAGTGDFGVSMSPVDNGPWVSTADHVARVAEIRGQVLALIEHLRTERCVSHNYGVALDDIAAALTEGRAT